MADNPRNKGRWTQESDIISGVRRMESELPEQARIDYLTAGLVTGLLPDGARRTFLDEHAKPQLCDFPPEDGKPHPCHLPDEVYELTNGSGAINGKTLVGLWQHFQKSYNRNFAGTPGFVPLNEYGFADHDSIQAAERVEALYRERYAQESADAMLTRYHAEYAGRPLNAGKLSPREIREGLVYMFQRGHETDAYGYDMLNYLKHRGLPEDLHRAVLKGSMENITGEERVRLWQQFAIYYNHDTDFNRARDFVPLNEYGIANDAVQIGAWFTKDAHNKAAQQGSPDSPHWVKQAREALSGVMANMESAASHVNPPPVRNTDKARTTPPR